MHIGWLIVAALACVTGLRAACLWWQASRIVANPVWVAEPGEAMASLQGWVFAMLEASSRSSRKNARAAIWTGISVGLSSLTALSGAMNL
ncbi:hypothetical protein SAMN04515659_0545 [Dyella sp. 333MFSha]|nr:hypothetical protein SAMN04515659_0545 [Dyella sp. 333MFSha]